MNQQELQRLRDLPIEGVAERLGLRVERHKSLCPFHDDRHPSLCYSPRRNTYRCFVCGAGGDTISLAMRHQGLDFRAACRWLADEHNVILSQWKPAPQEATRTFDPSRYARYLEYPWLNEAARTFLFAERHIHPQVVAWCRLTSWTDRQGVPWLTIPYFDQKGRLTGVQNRNLVAGALPRFRFPQGVECTTYNLPVLAMLRPGEPLWISEGASDCWSLLSSGHKAIAIPSATLLHPRDVEPLLLLVERLGTTLHMWPDGDEPGERLFLELQGLVPGLVRHQLPPGCKDYSDYYLRSGPP